MDILTYNQGQDILLSRYDKVSYATGDKYIGFARDLYTYDIASKTLTQLKTQSGQVALLSNPQGSPTSFQLFDFNDEKSITSQAFPNLPADIISGNNTQMNYQLIDGRTVVFADPYARQSSNIYIYQYPLKTVKNV